MVEVGLVLRLMAIGWRFGVSVFNSTLKIRIYDFSDSLFPRKLI